MKREIKITVDSETGPEIHYEGFAFAGEVILLMQLSIQILTEDLKDKMKSNLVKVAPAPFVTRK